MTETFKVLQSIDPVKLFDSTTNMSCILKLPPNAFGLTQLTELPIQKLTKSIFTKSIYKRDQLTESSASSEVDDEVQQQPEFIEDSENLFDDEEPMTRAEKKQFRVIQYNGLVQHYVELQQPQQPEPPLPPFIPYRDKLLIIGAVISLIFSVALMIVDANEMW